VKAVLRVRHIASMKTLIQLNQILKSSIK